jgi:hypothetical protein
MVQTELPTSKWRRSDSARKTEVEAVHREVHEGAADRGVQRNAGLSGGLRCGGRPHPADAIVATDTTATSPTALH